MSGDVIGLVALDFILGLVRGRPVPVAFVIEISVMNSDNPAGHPARLRIPTDMIANRKLSHGLCSSPNHKDTPGLSR